MKGRKIIELLFLLLIVSYVFLFQKDIANTYQLLLNKIDPCPTPIAYSIGQFDKEFNIDEGYFKSAIKEAEDIWEMAASRDLFEYKVDGKMKVSLIYDYRQESTSEINYLDSSLSQDNDYYLQLKSQYESLTAEYNQANQTLNNLVNSYNQRLAVYEKAVSAWSKKQGNQKQYDQLNQEKQDLENLASTIKDKQVEINSKVQGINQLAEQLNTLAKSLNLNINKYNDAVETTGQEFEQGNYISSPDSKEINIYQFENRDKLVRVLAHELGHALGIDHLPNPEDIMYSYNIGKNQTITEADLNELNQVCPN